MGNVIDELNAMVRKEISQKAISVIELEERAKSLMKVMKKNEREEYHFYRGFLRAIEMLRQHNLLKE